MLDMIIGIFVPTTKSNFIAKGLFEIHYETLRLEVNRNFKKRSLTLPSPASGEG